MSETPDMTGNLIEGFAIHWLHNTRVGRDMLGQMTLDAAVDAVFELLNGGYIKIAGTATELRDLVPCDPPEPPAQRINRPKRTPTNG